MTNMSDGASPEQLEREIAETRTEIDATLAAIQEKLSPGQLLDQALRYTRHHGGEFTSNVGRTVRDNPVPLALVGIGLSWLMLASNRPTNNVSTESSGTLKDSSSSAGAFVSKNAEAAKSSIGSTAEDLKRRTSELASETKAQLHQAGEATRRYGEAAKERFESARYQTVETARRTKDGASRAVDTAGRFVEDNPLVVGALALAAGAALGALVPSTRREGDLMGRDAERVRDAVKETAEESVEAVKKVAGAARSGARKGGKSVSRESAIKPDPDAGIPRTPKSNTGNVGKPPPGADNR